MRILGHGIDLVSVERVGKMREEHGERFLERCFTAGERKYCEDYKRPEERFAGRFAAKEAILKVLGTGWRGQIAWTDMEILPDGQGKPVLMLSGECARIAERAGIVGWHLSISHAAGLAMASAIGEG